ncbi:MAG: hypothetical protein GY842_24580 [bacterium]|nr:hypothetical protein [bacterium]
MNHTTGTNRTILSLVCLAGGYVAWPAHAEIVSIDATIRAEVQEFVGGEEGSFDSAFEEFGATSATLPIHVAARLLPTEGASTNAFVGAAFADFYDPAVSPNRNPGEVGLETDVYAPSAEVNFAARAVATETRRVVFNAEELLLEPGDTDREVISSVFVSGAVVIWWADSLLDLTGLSVELGVKVEKQTADADGDAEPVLEARLSVVGTAEGTLNVERRDGIFAVVGGTELISATAGFTESELLDELAGLGRVHIIIIPEQELPYSYPAEEDVEFDLRATFEAQTANLPGGTGVAAVYGRSFEELATMVAHLAPTETRGAATQAAVNAAIAESESPRGGQQTSATRLGAFSGNPCGVIGLGTLGFMLTLSIGVALRRTR